MTTATELVLLSGLPALMAAFLSFVGLILTMRNKQKLTEIHLQINSRMDAMLALVAKSAKAEGIKEQKDKELEPL